MKTVYQKGDRVKHRVFGGGLVIGLDERAGGVVVQFDGLKTERTISATFKGMRKEEARKWA